jgi:bla regulator protein blaR1
MVVEFIARSTLIAASAALAMWSFRIRGAAARHTLWTGVMMAMLGLPFCPKAPLPVLRYPKSAPAFVQPVIPELPAFRAATPATAPLPAPPFNWNAAALAVYLLGASTLLIRLGVGTFRATRLTSASCAAPVTVGLLRPRIILPDSAASWSAEQLEAVLIHEGAHVSRHDPLVQWLALLNRAIFWFHPLSWWLERRLTALAEEACDDAVLRRGLNPADYSAYLLDLARAVQRAGMRLNPVALSMPGSDLPRRIRRIASGAPLSRTSTARMTVAAAVLAICTGTFAAVTLDSAPQDILPKTPAVHPKFDVVSIRPCKPSDITQGAGKKGGRGGGGRFRGSPGSLIAECQTVENLVRQAYLNYPDGQPWPTDKTSGILIRPLPAAVLNQDIKGPGWMASDRYTIEAKGPGEPSMEMMRGPMMQTLLEDRFHLKIHVENRDVPVYILTVAPGGPKLQPTKPGSCISLVEWEEKYGQLPRQPGQWPQLPCGPFRPSILDRNHDMDRNVAERTIGVETHGQTMPVLCLQFSVGAQRDVIDRTGLTGQYDIHLELASQDLFPSGPPKDDAEPPPSPEEKLSHIAAAVQKLGLKLEPAKAPMPFVVIDRVERPTEN